MHTYVRKIKIQNFREKKRDLRERFKNERLQEKIT